MSKSVHDGHRNRLRQRYRQNGIDGFSDHELLELLLGYPLSRIDTNPLGHELIDRFGDLRGVMDADPEDLKKVDGMGDYTAFLLNLIPGVARRYFEEAGKQDLRFTNIRRMVDFFAPRFVGKKEEALYAAFLDDNHRLIYCEKQFDGSISSVEIHSRKIVREAQRCGAAFVVLAHNHFVDTNPSNQDVKSTNQLNEELKRVGIQLHDHIIICGNTGSSMVESGHFKKI